MPGNGLTGSEGEQTHLNVRSLVTHFDCPISTVCQLDLKRPVSHCARRTSRITKHEMLGLKKTLNFLVDYDPLWEVAFIEERKRDAA